MVMRSRLTIFLGVEIGELNECARYRQQMEKWSPQVGFLEVIGVPGPLVYQLLNEGNLEAFGESYDCASSCNPESGESIACNDLKDNENDQRLQVVEVSGPQVGRLINKANPELSKLHASSGLLGLEKSFIGRSTAISLARPVQMTTGDQR